MNLDILAGILTGLTAVVFFILHAITSAKHQQWVTLPQYVRIGLALTGAMFMIRAVNLLTLPPYPISAPGHMNLEGVFAAALMLYTLSATVHCLGKTLRSKARARQEALEREVYQIAPQAARKLRSRA